MQKHLTLQRDRHDVLAWRHDRLVDAGFPPVAAARIADDRRYDLHAMIELVEHGCRPDFAVRILAPLGAGAA